MNIWDGEVTRWVLWAALVFFQQVTYLFSGRAKTSASLWYSGIAGVFSHSSFFLSQMILIDVLIDYRELGWDLKWKLWCVYVFFAVLGTVTAQNAALKWLEHGKMRVGQSLNSK